MIARIFVAAIGGLIVTGILLLSMRTLTTLFQDDSRERYFRITDVLPKPDPGRPVRPEAGSRQPATLAPEVENPDASVPIEVPLAIESSVPELEAPDLGNAVSDPIQ